MVIVKYLREVDIWILMNFLKIVFYIRYFFKFFFLGEWCLGIVGIFKERFVYLYINI